MSLKFTITLEEQPGLATTVSTFNKARAQLLDYLKQNKLEQARVVGHIDDIESWLQQVQTLGLEKAEQAERDKEAAKRRLEEQEKQATEMIRLQEQETLVAEARKESYNQALEKFKRESAIAKK